VGAMTGVNGKRISGTPNYILGIGADYRIDAKNAINWKTRLVGNQYPQGDNQNSYELGAYSISDFGYRWNDKKWAIFANVNNVFDKKYGSSVLADQSNRASANYPYVMYPNWGRNYTLTLRYSFD
jgi:outer membrane receptor protein involved in Fe transport